MKSAYQRPLRPGDVVEVRSLTEILATLDNDAAVEKMPFMPEMAQYAGRRFTVTRRVEKICDTIASSGSRRMNATVYLDDLRCDGSGHEGCQAGCKIYWKEAWLRLVDDRPGSGEKGTDATAAVVKLDHLARTGTRTVRNLEGKPSEVWRCQATEAFVATQPLKASNLAQYWRELTNGNFGLLRFIFVAVRGFPMEIASRLGLLRPLPLRGAGTHSKTAGLLDLKPGDLVQVRSPTEIAATLDEKGHNRGLSFDREMLPYCGRTFRVKDKVRRIVDDKTGRMLNIPKDCVILEGAVCSGELTTGNWYCPRQIYPYWREAWLRKVENADGVTPEMAPACRSASNCRSASKQSMPHA